MATAFRPRALVLFIGDIIFFGLALWVSLALRSFSLPDLMLLKAYFPPFIPLAALWVGVYVVAGLYESRSIIFGRRALSKTLLVAQTINVIFAALFFFALPLFAVAPKIVLLIYLGVSFVGALVWRVFVFPWLGLQKIEAAIVVGEGPEIDELVGAIQGAPRAPTRISCVISPASPHFADEVSSAIAQYQPRFVIADFRNPRTASLPQLYNMVSRGICFFDAGDLYEEIFGRIPLSLVDNRWVVRNVSRYTTRLYDFLKRGMDIVGAIIFGAVTLVLYPFFALAIVLEDGLPITIAQDRVGKNNKLVRIHKFRTMSGNDNGVYGAEGTTKLHVTKVGAFLRAWRFDELLQLWNVLKGDLSLIGPRLELPPLVKEYEAQIPYYDIRHLIKPGLSGWAQLYHHADPHHGTDVEATKMKLSYDLYYLKHRSLALDCIIAIKTVRRLLLRGNA